MVTRALLVCEGTSDVPLVSHIQRLMDSVGHRDSIFDAATEGRLLVDKIKNGLSLASQFDLVFIHRDADRAGAEARYSEISAAIRESNYDGQWVGVVPVRTIEAWLLLDQLAIRSIAGYPHGRIELDLPAPSAAERLPDPKSSLRNALLEAADVNGRRRRMMARRLPALRDRLLANLPVGGQIEHLESWTRFRDDTVAALSRLSN